MANMPHGVPSRLVAMHRRRLVRPLLNCAFSMASRQWTLPAAMGCGLGMSQLLFAPIKTVDCCRRRLAAKSLAASTSCAKKFAVKSPMITKNEISETEASERLDMGVAQLLAIAKKVRKPIVTRCCWCRRAGRIADGKRSRSSADGSAGSAPRSGQMSE
jgi:hypothetical protein